VTLPLLTPDDIMGVAKLKSRRMACALMRRAGAWKVNEDYRISTEDWEAWIRTIETEPTISVRVFDNSQDQFGSLSKLAPLVLKRDRKCVYCGDKKNLTIDHVLPRSRGGQDALSNLVAACRSCNCRKSNRTPAEAGMQPIYMKTKWVPIAGVNS
jgi:5-methylcytosine-specific restriction endonuclease McrA